MILIAVLTHSLPAFLRTFGQAELRAETEQPSMDSSGNSPCDSIIDGCNSFIQFLINFYKSADISGFINKHRFRSRPELTVDS